MSDTQVATTDARPPLVVLRERLESRKSELQHALIDIKPEVFIRALITSAQINPDLLGCTWQSVWTACMRACRDGLLPDGVEGAIVPFKTTAQWIPMYQGLLRRFRKSGQFKWVNAGLVRQGEPFEHWIDETGEHFKHIPGDDIDKPIIKIYALATTKDGGFFVAVLPIAEADKIRRMSRTTRDDSPWKLWPEEMYKKTALRRLSKLLPSARDLLGDDDDLSDIAAPPLAPPASAPAIEHQQPMPVPAREGATESEPQSTGTAGRPDDQQPEPQRASGAAAALEQFAGASAGTDVRHPAAGGGSDARPGPGVPAPSARAPAAAKPVEITAAHKRGALAREQGHERKAVPGEYRGQNATALAAAWVRGWDGEPL